MLNYTYHQDYYKVIGIDSSMQTNTSIFQQINFTGILEENDGAKIFFIAENQQKLYSKLFFRFIYRNRII